MKESLDNQIIIGKTESFFPITRQNLKKGIFGTEKKIFGEDTPIRVTTKGRPKINRNLARRLFQARFKPSQVATQLKCHVKTARRIRRELEEDGELETRLRLKPMDIVQADFDAECKMATGYSFYEWMKNQTKGYSQIFNFCRRCWERELVWGKPSLVLTKDRDSQLGDQLCMKWLEIFGDDKKRIRYRKKWIRYLFRFLGRHDLCDRHLRMTKSRDPIPVRRIPEIELPNFPLHYEAAINEMAMKGFVYETAAKFKTITQMRIGNRKEQRGLLGLRVGSSSRSYILMNGPDEFRCRVLEKRNEVWDITWIPKSIREALWEIY